MDKYMSDRLYFASALTHLKRGGHDVLIDVLILLQISWTEWRWKSFVNRLTFVKGRYERM